MLVTRSRPAYGANIAGSRASEAWGGVRRRWIPRVASQMRPLTWGAPSADGSRELRAQSGPARGSGSWNGRHPEMRLYEYDLEPCERPASALDPKSVRCAFTMDVEDWYQSTIDFDAPIHDRVLRNMDRVRPVLAEYGIKGTFFMQGRVAETF